jgi:hypothetical protein
MPKSSVGPMKVSLGVLRSCRLAHLQQRGHWWATACGHTSGVVAGCQQDTTGGLAYPDDMAGSWRAENAFLADQQLLDAVGSTNLRDELGNLGVPVPAVAANDESRAFNALRNGEQDAGNEGL